MKPIRLNQALVLPQLIAGGEREPIGIVTGCGLGLLAMGWQFLSIACAVTGILCLTVGLYAVRRMAKRDPQMFAVYREFIGYRSFYPARSTPFRRK